MVEVVRGAVDPGPGRPRRGGAVTGRQDGPVPGSGRVAVGCVSARRGRQCQSADRLPQERSARGGADRRGRHQDDAGKRHRRTQVPRYGQGRANLHCVRRDAERRGAEARRHRRRHRLQGLPRRRLEGRRTQGVEARPRLRTHRGRWQADVFHQSPELRGGDPRREDGCLLRQEGAWPRYENQQGTDSSTAERRRRHLSEHGRGQQGVRRADQDGQGRDRGSAQSRGGWAGQEPARHDGSGPQPDRPVVPGG